MCPKPQETADLVTFTEEILNGKIHFFCAVTGSPTNHELLTVLIFKLYIFNVRNNLQFYIQQFFYLTESHFY